MTQKWQLQDAKARFSELFSEVLSSGAQYVSRRGKETIVLIPEDEYRKLKGEESSFISFLFSSPKATLDLARSQDSGRTVDL
ncbi:MAG TPA: type II toxin-antitoxin system Phd/YefM family antitoxin [Treponemataceae bacterium]|nr:type II toxin-antitoxin system Phd/YefM family antitoxin [Treponemataceae bacterium]